MAIGWGAALVFVLVPSCNILTGADNVELVSSSGTGATGAGGNTSTAGGGGHTSTGGQGGTGGEGLADASDAPDLDAPPLDSGPDALDPNGDEDLDGVLNAADNCPEDFNPCQYDRDNDDVGDLCDGTCEEHCSVRTCGWPDARGCNCSGCPAEYRCVWDSHYENGRYGDVPLPDGGTHHCDSEWYEVCAKICSSSEPCTMGTCLDLGSGCICFSFAMLPPCLS